MGWHYLALLTFDILLKGALSYSTTSLDGEPMTDSTSHSAGPGEPDPDFIRWFREYSVPIASVIAGVLLWCLGVLQICKRANFPRQIDTNSKRQVSFG